MHGIRLIGYKAYLEKEETVLQLGTKESFGIEQMHITADEAWDGLTVTATFHPPQGEPVRLLIPTDGVIPVPPEATAQAATMGYAGKIVFAGTADGVLRITTDLLYLCADHADHEGNESTAPTPDMVSQILNRTAEDRTAAEEAAFRAEAAAAHPPIIREGFWWVWDTTTGAYTNTGTAASGGGTTGYQIGYGLKVTEDNTLMVEAAHDFSGDNTLPITAAAVQNTIGNIQTLLGTI